MSETSDTLQNAAATAAGTATIGRGHDERPTFASISERAANLRDVVELVGSDVKELHHETALRSLDERAAMIGMQDPAEMLETLGTAYGLGWSTVARMIGVTPTAIRKWRRREQITPANRRKLASLLAFLEVLQNPFPVADPASWLEMPISAEATLCPADIYAAGRLELLIDFAGRRRAAHGVLDAFDPEWRMRYALDDRFDVVRAPDGDLSLVQKARGH